MSSHDKSNRVSLLDNDFTSHFDLFQTRGDVQGGKMRLQSVYLEV